MRRRFFAPSKWTRAAMAAAVAIAALAAQPARPAHAGVMLEDFYIDCPSGYGSTWWWDKLANQSNTLASDGFSAIWIPCALKGASGGYSSGYDPWDDYDLGDKNQEGTIPTHYGTRTQLERACAVVKANGMQVYEDIVDSHRDGDSGNYSFQYPDAYGNANAGRFPKGASDFYPNAPMASDVPDQSDTPDGRWIMPTTGGQYSVNGQEVVYSGYNMELSGDWLTKALDLNGYRLDDVKASPESWIYNFLQYGTMAGKFAVGEYYDGSVSNVTGWISAEQNRASAFDFPLKFNYLNPMCNNPSSFNMSTLNGAGLVAANPGGAVTFVENHDTDGGSNAITQDKLLAYAYILTSQGYPCVFYKDWSTDSGCYGSGLQAGINNLMWIHEKIASGSTTQRWSNSQIYVFERTGGSHLLVGMSDNTGYTSTITCATGFGANVHLHDYTGHEPDVYTDGSGNATITIPADSSGGSYVAYSVYGITGSFTPTATATTQEYDGAQDLDIKPADNARFVTAAELEVQKGATINGSLYFDTTGWTSSSTNISLRLLDPTGAIVKTTSYSATTKQGYAITTTAAMTGLYTFLIRSNNTPSTNLKPAYYLKATYTAPSTVIPVTFTIANANTTGSQQVYVEGNDADLGNFSPANAFLLNESGSGSSATWSGEIALPASTAIQYLYVKWDGKTAVPEGKQNTSSGYRQITTPSSGTLTENNGKF